MQSKKLLLVDDDVAFNFLNRILLKTDSIDWEVDECLDGSAALNYVLNSGKCPDIILLDINMPIMDGFEFLEEFAKIDRCGNITKIFMLTSSMQDEDRTAAFKYPCVKGYFDKPLTIEHIKEIISLLEKS